MKCIQDLFQDDFMCACMNIYAIIYTYIICIYIFIILYIYIHTYIYMIAHVISYVYTSLTVTYPHVISQHVGTCIRNVIRSSAIPVPTL